MKKRIIIAIVVMTVFAIFTFRFYKVNSNIPLKFTMENTDVGNVVKCDGLEIKIISTETRESEVTNPVGMEFIEFVVTSTIKNTSKEAINAIEFQTSPIVINYYYAQAGPAKVKNGDLRNVNPGEEIVTEQSYIIEKERYEKERSSIFVYLSEDLYENEINEKFFEGIRYRKAIKV